MRAAAQSRCGVLPAGCRPCGWTARQAEIYIQLVSRATKHSSQRRIWSPLRFLRKKQPSVKIDPLQHYPLSFEMFHRDIPLACPCTYPRRTVQRARHDRQVLDFWTLLLVWLGSSVGFLLYLRRTKACSGWVGGQLFHTRESEAPKSSIHVYARAASVRAANRIYSKRAS